MEAKFTFPGGSRVQARIGEFVIETDQPVKEGGEGSAPPPFDYFLASIGACAGHYVLTFLQRRGLPTEDASLQLITHRDPECGSFRKITIEVSLPDDFPKKYRSAIVSAVDLCSVKRHISNAPTFETVVRIGDEEAMPAA